MATVKLNALAAADWGTNTDTSGTVTGFNIAPTYNQASGTAANTDLLVNRTETAVGSGLQKLADFQGYDQSEGAEIMGISRPSFGRLLRSGRKAVADALVNGKIIRIRIANVQVGVRQKNVPHKKDSQGVHDLKHFEEALRRNIFKNHTVK